MRMMREHDEKVCGAVVVSMMGGFTGSIVRAVTTGMILAVRPKMPVRVFASVPEGAGFVTGLYAKGVAGASADEIVHAIAQVQKAIQA